MNCNYKKPVISTTGFLFGVKARDEALIAALLNRNHTHQHWIQAARVGHDARQHKGVGKRLARVEQARGSPIKEENGLRRCVMVGPDDGCPDGNCN